MDCGPTCIKIISKYYGVDIDTNSIIRISGILRSGVSVSNLVSASEKIGYRSIPVNVEFSALEKDVPLPCIAYIGKLHYVVVYKIHKGYVYVSDPAYGLIKYNFKEFCDLWILSTSLEKNKGILVLLEPRSELFKNEYSSEKRGGIWFIFKYFSEHRKLFNQLLIALFLSSLIELIFPFFTQAIVDQGIKNSDLNFISVLLVGQLTFFFAQTIIGFIRGWLLLHIGMRVSVSIISDFLYKILRLPAYIFDIKTLGDLIQRIDDNRRIESFLSNNSLSMLFSFINIFLLGLILLIYNIKIFLIFFVGTVLYILWILIFIKKNSFWEHKRVQKNSEEREKIIQLINGIKDIKLNNSLVKRTSQWKFIQNQLFHISSKKLYFIQIQNNGALFINEFKNIIILFITANLVIKGSMTLGMMLSVQYIIGYLNRPIRDIITFVQSWDETNIRIERMDEILKESDEGEDTTIDKIPKDKSIIFNNVSFGYGGKDSIKVIKNINLIIPENKTTAIVGTSGSGKTTLINLILKFYEVTDGEILIGNTDLNKIDTSLWRLQCGAVLQDSLIFTDTIANNISESEQAEIIDKDQLMKASRLANLDEDLIERLPSGYDSVVGSGGIKLSGGQIQRLLIARAIYKDPNYLFFDEATSSLDANNEKIIVENMNQVFNKKTVVVVAHRLSTVKNADKIVVLHSGEIVEEGTHEELVLQKKFYYNLVKNQLELGK